VTLGTFFLDRTEVTNRAYAGCVRAGASRAPDPASAHHFGPDAAFRGPKQPVSSISWDDTGAHCVFVGKRLPTEAEFERAARGDDQRIYPWGDDPPNHERPVSSSAGSRCRLEYDESFQAMPRTRPSARSSLLIP
jgi:formylglycine-generating enzyme required for sulfatase activity